MSKSSKDIKYLVMQLLPIFIGIFFSILGWFVDEKIQLSQHNNVMQIIEEIITSDIADDKEYKAIENLLTPSTFRLNRFVFSILSFFFGIFITNYFIEIIRESRQDKNENADRSLNLFDIDTTEDFIASFLDHLAEECFSKCSNVSAKCSTCEKFPDNCDGLLRNYLFHEASDLRDAIRNSRKGEYALATNIEKYHTIAIDHLIVYKSKHYKVVQWIGSELPKEETYDRLDFHFLNSLLSKIIEANKNGPSYKKQDFKIKWLLIGNIDNMKNNFDYIFFVIKSMGLQNDVKEFFEFYIMSEENYKANADPLMATYNDFVKRMLNIDKNSYKPSFGIFGSHFLFADASDENQHGTIYTKKFKPDGDLSTKNLVDELNVFFDKILSKSKNITIDDLYKKYNEIINNDNSWEETLEKRWHPEKPTV